MTHCEAMKILDRIRDGQQYPLKTINTALELTGDLESRGFEEFGSEGVDQSLQKQSERLGSLRSPTVVAKDVIRHSADSWAICR